MDIKLSFLDRFLIFHPNLWKDQYWKACNGLPLEDVLFTAPRERKLFGWQGGELRYISCEGRVTATCGNITKWRQ